LDWENLVWRVTGPEGGQRYFRLGVFMIVLASVSMVAIAFLPIFSSDEGTVRYDEMADDPDGNPFGATNSHVLGHARWALAGSFLSIIMGIVLLLEGKRVINLRRILSWHAEARATALYSLSALLASISLLAGVSLLSLSLNVPWATGEGSTSTIDMSSPAAIVVVATMGLVTFGMVYMAYFNCVLSVYRGRVTPDTRKMARISMYLAMGSILGVLAMRLGPIMVAHIEIQLGVGETFELFNPFSWSLIDYLASRELGIYDRMGTLNWQLSAAHALLFISFMAGMAGMIGTSAFSLGGRSLRVRRATSMPAVGGDLAIIALLLMVWAIFTAPTAARESLQSDEYLVSVGWGLYIGLAGSIAALALALLFMKLVGLEFIKDALMFWKKEEVVPEEEEGIYQPMLDEALAEEAMVAETSVEEETITPPSIEVVGRRFTMKPRRLQVILAVVIVVLIVLLAVWRPGGGDDNGGGGGSDPVLIDELRDFQDGYSLSNYMFEGDDTNFDVLENAYLESSTTVYFVDNVHARIEWTDESAPNPLWTNQPDTFALNIHDHYALDDVTQSSPNPPGAMGSVSMDWSTGGGWIVYGNTSLVDWGDQEVYDDFDGSKVTVNVLMEAAGDLITRFGRTSTDDGNNFTVTITISGQYYRIGEDGQ
jgi:hypothetical protein